MKKNKLIFIIVLITIIVLLTVVVKSYVFTCNNKRFLFTNVSDTLFFSKKDWIYIGEKSIGCFNNSPVYKYSFVSVTLGGNYDGYISFDSTNIYILEREKRAFFCKKFKIYSIFNLKSPINVSYNINNAQMRLLKIKKIKDDEIIYFFSSKPIIYYCNDCCNEQVFAISNKNGIIGMACYETNEKNEIILLNIIGGTIFKKYSNFLIYPEGTNLPPSPDQIIIW